MILGKLNSLQYINIVEAEIKALEKNEDLNNVPIS